MLTHVQGETAEGTGRQQTKWKRRTQRFALTLSCAACTKTVGCAPACQVSHIVMAHRCSSCFWSCLNGREETARAQRRRASCIVALTPLAACLAWGCRMHQIMSADLLQFVQYRKVGTIELAWTLRLTKSCSFGMRTAPLHSSNPSSSRAAWLCCRDSQRIGLRSWTRPSTSLRLSVHSNRHALDQ